MLFTVEFYITMGYSILSCVLYILISYLIIKHKPIFSGSYYNIILIDSAVNVFSFLTAIPSFRVPRGTGKDSLFADILPDIPFSNFFGCMLCHLPYVQYLMVLSLIFNRFTAIVFYRKYKEIWEYLFIPLMLFNMFFPFTFTWQWFIVAVSFAYNKLRDQYMLISSPDLYEALNWSLLIIRIVVAILSAILMVATIFFYKYKVKRTVPDTLYLQAKVRDQRVEVGLLIFSVISFLIQLFGTFVTLTQYLDAAWKISELKTMGQVVLPYARDLTTFSPPYVLLLCSRRLRILLKEMFVRSSTKRSVVTPMYGRHTV